MRMLTSRNADKLPTGRVLTSRLQGGVLKC
jgi:hypothetical protein